MKLRTLSVGEKAAIIKNLNLSTTTASKVFGMPEHEVTVTLKTIENGLFKPAILSKKQLSAYKKLIDTLDISSIEIPTRERKKRGRKTNRIQVAYANIPYTPIELDTFIKKYNVSQAVMKQHKRFDPFPEKGRIIIKKDKQTKKVFIWRENNNE